MILRYDQKIVDVFWFFRDPTRGNETKTIKKQLRGII